MRRHYGVQHTVAIARDYRALAVEAVTDALSDAGVDVVALHDCLTSNALLHYEALQRAGPGAVERIIRDAMVAKW